MQSNSAQQDIGERKTLIYYNLSFILVAPAIGSIDRDVFALMKVGLEIFKCIQLGEKHELSARLSTTLFGGRTESNHTCNVAKKITRTVHEKDTQLGRVQLWWMFTTWVVIWPLEFVL